MGLYDTTWRPNSDLTVEDTQSVIHVLCTAYKDE